MIRPFIKLNAHALALRTNRSVQQVEFILGLLEGLDDHDWYIELSKLLGISTERLMQELFLTWVTDNNNEAIARQAFIELMTMLEQE